MMGLKPSVWQNKEKINNKGKCDHYQNYPVWTYMYPVHFSLVTAK